MTDNNKKEILWKLVEKSLKERKGKPLLKGDRSVDDKIFSPDNIDHNLEEKNNFDGIGSPEIEYGATDDRKIMSEDIVKISGGKSGSAEGSETGGEGTGSAKISSEALVEYIQSLTGRGVSPYESDLYAEDIKKAVESGEFRFPAEVLESLRQASESDIKEGLKNKDRPKYYAAVKRDRPVRAGVIKEGESHKKRHARELKPEDLKKERPLSPWKTPKPSPF